jgi:hypothetical protein
MALLHAARDAGGDCQAIGIQPGNQSHRPPLSAHGVGNVRRQRLD